MRGRRSVEKRLVWILGGPRSGSTWLVNLLAAHPAVVKIDEPGIGSHLGVSISGLFGFVADRPPVARLNEMRADDPDYFFSREHEAAWREPLRQLLVDRFAAQLGRGQLAAIKEPHGSLGADILMATLPRSRLVFLLRDGRDAIDSALDAAADGSWAMSRLPGFEVRERAEFIRDRAHQWLWRTETVQRAFDGHDTSLRRMLKYEDLRAEPEPALRSLTGWLGIDPGPALAAAEATAFESLPPESRGAGRFVRAAEPGLWREHLSTQEQRVVHEIIGEKLRELGYEA